MDLELRITLSSAYYPCRLNYALPEAKTVYVRLFEMCYDFWEWQNVVLITCLTEGNF